MDANQSKLLSENMRDVVFFVYLGCSVSINIRANAQYHNVARSRSFRSTRFASDPSTVALEGVAICSSRLVPIPSVHHSTRHHAQLSFYRQYPQRTSNSRMIHRSSRIIRRAWDAHPLRSRILSQHDPWRWRPDYRRTFCNKKQPDYRSTWWQRWLVSQRAYANSSFSLRSAAHAALFPGFPIGFTAGLGGACAGVGGAVFIIPALVQFAGAGQRVAQGTALLAACGTSAAAAYHYSRAGEVDVPAAVQLMVSSAILAPVGVAIGQRLNADVLRRGLGWFLVGVSVLLPLRALLTQSWTSRSLPIKDACDQQAMDDPITGAVSKREEWQANSASQDECNGDAMVPETSRDRWPSLEKVHASLLSTGGAVGLISGLLGVSGGTLFMPVLAIFFASNPSSRPATGESAHPRQPSRGLSKDSGLHTIIGTSMMAMLLPAVVAGISYARRGNVSFVLLPGVLAGTIVGASVGSKVALHVDEFVLRFGFAVVFAAMGIRMVRVPITT